MPHSLVVGPPNSSDDRGEGNDCPLQEEAFKREALAALQRSLVERLRPLRHDIPLPFKLNKVSCLRL